MTFALPKDAASLTAPAAFLALAAAAIAMGISPVFVRTAETGAFTSAFWRVGLALPVLWLWMRAAENGAKPAETPFFPRATILAGLAFAGDLICWHLSIFNTSVANATFFATTAPIFVALVGWLAFGVSVTWATIGGVALCLLGGAALAAQSFAAAPSHVLGDLLGVCTAFFFGMYFLAVGAARKKSNAARVTFESTCVTASVLLVVALAMEGRLSPWTTNGWMSLFGLALISQVLGQGLLALALGRLPPLFSSLVIFLEAIAAALFGWLFLGEPVSLVQAFGGLLILAGIFASRPRGSDESGASAPGLS